MIIEAEFPDKLQFLFEPHRYKVARGGRGSAKSWSFARALLTLSTAKTLRILCTREIQKSIKDSVHKLLSDQIQLIGLGSKFTVLETEIRNATGTLFIFAGLADHTIESIKSYEGVDIVWCEEAHVISKRSWDILLPTIRKDNSEIWITYNPELDTDETHVRFTVDPPDDCVNVVMNWRDNPWFNEVLEKERQRCLKFSPSDYENIWEGQCKKAVAGAIWAEEIAKAQDDGRICNCPYDPLLKVHVVLDLGFNDAMFITMVQRTRSEIRVIDELVDEHKTNDWYSAELKKRNYNWGKMWLPHDGFSHERKTGKTDAEIFEALGWDVVPRDQIAEMGIEPGIRQTRMKFGQLVFNKANVPTTIQCAKRYKRSINQQTKEPGPPLHDEWSHGGDNIRYICINADNMSNDMGAGSDWRKSAGSKTGRFKA